MKVVPREVIALVSVLFGFLLRDTGARRVRASRSQPVEMLVGGKYRLGRRMHEGIYLGADRTTGNEVAVKLEYFFSSKAKLVFEAGWYEVLGVRAGFPRVYWHGQQDDYDVLVTELLGPSLKELASAGALSPKQVVALSDQMLDRVEYVHTKFAIHRDIKPGHFLVGLDANEGHVHLIDFGSAKTYMHPDTLQHAAYQENVSFVGSPDFASVNAKMGVGQSRRDDLEALSNVLIYLFDEAQRRSKDEITRIWQSHMKENTTTLSDELWQKTHDGLVTFRTYCRSLGFAEKPDYVYLHELLRGLTL